MARKIITAGAFLIGLLVLSGTASGTGVWGIAKAFGYGGGGGQFTPTTAVQSGTQGQVLGAATYNFTVDLHIGMRGQDVTELQKFLIANGYSIGYGATGYFGVQTRAALIAFQKAHSITPAAGYFGIITRGVVNAGTLPTSEQH